MNSSVQKWETVPAPLVTSALLLLLSIHL